MKKILIVDDSLLDRKLLFKALTVLGVKNSVLQAENGEAALELIAQNIDDIALVFVDYQMPIMNGIELITALTKVPDTAHIPIIMITASAAQESRDAAYRANPRLAGYVLKPYKPDHLSELIKPYVNIE